MDTPPSISLHEKILTEIKQQILSGQWPPGYRIPSEIELTEQYQCSRMTVNKVLTLLARAGMIERRRKAGSFVTRPHNGGGAVLEIRDIRNEVEATGKVYRTELIQRQRRRSIRADMDALQLEKPLSVLYLISMHYADDAPFCLEERRISLQAVPAAADELFAQEPPGTWLYQHVPWSSAEHRIRATAADAATAALLKIRKGSPCLVIERRTWTEDQPVTQVQLTYPASETELVARFSPSSTGLN